MRYTLIILVFSLLFMQVLSISYKIQAKEQPSLYLGLQDTVWTNLKKENKHVILIKLLSGMSKNN